MWLARLLHPFPNDAPAPGPCRLCDRLAPPDRTGVPRHPTCVARVVAVYTREATPYTTWPGPASAAALRTYPPTRAAAAPPAAA